MVKLKKAECVAASAEAISSRLDTLLDAACYNSDCAVIITNPSNIFYFSGYLADFALILLAHGKRYYLSDSRFTIEAAHKLDGAFEFVETTPRRVSETNIKLLGRGITRIKADAGIDYFEFKSIIDSLNEFEIEFINRDIDAMREIKTDYELEMIRRAERISEQALYDIFPYIKRGVTERELKLRLEFAMGMRGSEAVAFDTIVAFGENAACAHAKAGDRELLDGEFVLIDFGSTYRGYRSDMTRTLAYGCVSDKMMDVYAAVLSANIRGIEAVKAGVMCQAADKAARDELKKHGLDKYFTHSTGHGVGLDIHEKPALSLASDDVFKDGQVVTVEPGVYIDGVLGVRIEDMIAVGKGNLTECGKELIRLD